MLDADLKHTCYTGTHQQYVPIAIMSIVLFILGIPLITFLLLYRNRRQLHHPNVIAQYGDLYKKYDDRWYWWEPILMLQKCMLTGAMCAIAPGSAVQLLVASLVSLGYLLLILKAEPYVGILEDRLAFMTQLALTVSLILGLCLIMDDPSNPTFNKDIMGVVLVCLNILPFLYLIYACIQLMRKGSSAGIHVVNNVVHVVPHTNDKTRKKGPLGRKISLHQIRTVVLHDKVVKIATSHENARARHIDCIKEREKKADARVRQRLIDRRNNRNEIVPKSNVTSKPTQPPTNLVPVPTAKEKNLIEKLRLKILKKFSTLKELNVLFQKLDVDSNGMLSKSELHRLVAGASKVKSSERIDQFMWEAVWEKRKHGDDDEMDAATFGHWIGVKF